MCPNSSNGQHNYQMKTVVLPEGNVVYRECVLCGHKG